MRRCCIYLQVFLIVLTTFVRFGTALAITTEKSSISPHSVIHLSIGEKIFNNNNATYSNHLDWYLESYLTEIELDEDEGQGSTEPQSDSYENDILAKNGFKIVPHGPPSVKVAYNSIVANFGIRSRCIWFCVFRI